MRAKEKSTPQKVKGNETWSWLSDIFSFPGEDVCLIENETCLASPPYIVQLIHYTPLYIQFQGSGYIVGCIPRSLIPSWYQDQVRPQGHHSRHQVQVPGPKNHHKCSAISAASLKRSCLRLFWKKLPMLILNNSHRYPHYFGMISPLLLACFNMPFPLMISPTTVWRRKPLRSFLPDPSWGRSVHVALPCCLGTVYCGHVVFQNVFLVSKCQNSKPHSKLFTSKFFFWLLSTSSVTCLNTPEAIWDHHQKPKFHCCPRWMWSHVSSHFSHLASGGQQLCTSTKVSNLQNSYGTLALCLLMK